jgi:large subunit ribosomal protein L25
VSLISDPEMLVVNVVAAPTAEDLESEGAGEAVEGAGEGAEEGEEGAEAADGEGGGEESSGSDDSSE